MRGRVLVVAAVGVLLVWSFGCQKQGASEPASPTPQLREVSQTSQPATQPEQPAENTTVQTSVSEPQESQPADQSSNGGSELVKVPLGLPPVPIPEDNPMTPEKIELGKLLYFDTRLSADGTISCATCHDPKKAWAEHTPTSTGIKGQVGPANSPTVINSAYATSLFWDGRAKTLEEQAAGPVENPIEMGHSFDKLVEQLNQIPEYKERFQKVFGTEVTKDGIVKAIAAFERTILSGNSPYDRYVELNDEDALTESQKRGLELFEQYCSACHTPPLFSNYRFYNAGIGMDKDPPDEGRKAVTGRDADLGKFRVPPLREVANTAPYFHDGSVATLEEAVRIMAKGGKDNPKLSPMLRAVAQANLSDQDIKDLVEFLKALSGEFPIVEPPELP